jgi:hypothetical protein
MRKIKSGKGTCTMDKELIHCWAINRRDFAKLVLGLFGTAGSRFASVSAAAKAAEAGGAEVLRVLPYGVGPCWPAAYGDVRARIRVPAASGAVWVHIPWRRRDLDAAEKDVLLIDARTGQPVKNLARIKVTREFGDLVFEPPTAPGEYHLYYMPYQTTPVQWAYRVQYDHPELTADPAWLERHHLQAHALSGGVWKSLPPAEVLEIQARSEFDRFDPMEVIATQEETQKLLAENPTEDFLLFPEERQFPIRMADDLPLRWITKGPHNQFHGEARRGEFFVFQVGVFASRIPIEKLSIEYGDLRSARGSTIPASAIGCFNTGGKDWLGRRMTKGFAVASGKIGALWFGVQVPKEAPTGDYRGVLVMRVQGREATRLELSLTVTSKLLEDAGDRELWRHSRLRWLNSTVGIDDEVTAPYTPIRVEGRTVSCLGRKVRLASSGLPESIECGGREVLAGHIDFVVEPPEGKAFWSGGKVAIRKTTPGAVAWESSLSGGKFELHCQAEMEFDGYTYFSLHLQAREAAQLKDIRLEIPFRKDVAFYMMGLGRKGGYRPKEWKWTWDIERAINNVWMGDYNAGLQLKLKGPEDTWDIYDLKAAGIPSAWGNDGKGGCTISEEGDRVVVRAYSGERTLRAGDKLLFRFGLLATPVKPLDPAHWSQRYYHIYGPPENAARCGATIINVHQGNELNPYINYPFLTTDKLAAYVNEAHTLGLKVKIYYTVRELSNHVVEFWALRSLGNEVFVDGPGGGGAWLREHVLSRYAPAWHETLPTGELDAAIATTGLSRWHNYYLEGLAWLLRNVEIDGLYLDGIGYDRQIMKRVRKVLDRNRPGSLIDFHSGNEFPFNNLHISPANKYLEHFPYINSLWFGEGYDYNESPDYWLVEISGIPFGLFGEMLEGNGNPWRGMIYGMTARYYSGADPKHIWRLWDEFGIQDAEMIGYWVPSCPVSPSRKDVLVTVYKKNRRSLISLASWAKEPLSCRLSIDWQALGLDPKKAKISAPPIEGFQKAAAFKPSSEIPLEPGKGWLLILDEA